MGLANRISVSLASVVITAATGCSDHAPNALGSREPTGTAIRYEIASPLLAGVPWPNDSLCFSREDRSVPCHPNASVANVNPTFADWIRSVNATEGWSGTGRISLPFVRASDNLIGPAIDLSLLLASQRDFDFANDSIYLIDLGTGLPVSLDFDKALTSNVLRQPIALDPADPHRNETTLLLDTEDERFDSKTGSFDFARTTDGTSTGPANYQQKWDRDSDGVLDVPIYERGRSCMPRNPTGGAADIEHDRCVTDNLVDVYDPVSDILRFRPRAPLNEASSYAVVVTERLTDLQQRLIQSPFALPHHPTQSAVGSRVAAILNNANLSTYYGSISGRGLAGVEFLWGFTTSSPVASLKQLATSVAGKSSDERLEFNGDFSLDDPCDTGSPRTALVELLSAAYSLSPSEKSAVAEALSNIGSVRTGQFSHPTYTDSTDNRLRVRSAVAITRDTAPFLMTVPRDSRTSSTLRTALYAHDTATNKLDALRWAGHFARLGLGVIAMDRIGSPNPVSPEIAANLTAISGKHCASAMIEALVSGRESNLPSTLSPLGLDVISTAERWRASAIEFARLSSALGMAKIPAGKANALASTDITGYIGQGEGAAIALMAATLPPAPAAVIAVDAPTSPHRAWARATSWGTGNTGLYGLFGPRIAGVPASASNEAANSNCISTQSSVRLVDGNTGAIGTELGCVALETAASLTYPEGATVVATNLRSLERRCVVMTSAGEFSLGLAAATGDDFELTIYPGLDVVRRLGRDDDCTLRAKHPEPNYILNTAALGGRGVLPNGIAGGLGLERQTPEFRSALDWAESAFQLANSASYFSRLAESAPGPDATGTLIVVSPGDPLVAPDEGVRLAVAAGLVPNLPADTLAARAATARDTTPTPLASSLRASTAELALSASHLAEGVPRLLRHDPEPANCGVNHTLDAAMSFICAPDCSDSRQCPRDTFCGASATCEVGVPSSATCAEYLFDADRLADGTTGLNSESAIIPYRLGRYAGKISENHLTELWQPRAAIKSGSAITVPLHPNWPMTALALPLSQPQGSHGIPTDDQCQQFRWGTYLSQVFAQFLSTEGRSYPPISEWPTQSCYASSNVITDCATQSTP